MEPTSVDLPALWLQLKDIINAKVMDFVEPYFLNMLFADAMKEKARLENDQIIARVMYKPCFSYNKEKEARTITVRMKFRLLARYYLQLQDYHNYGMVVMSSIIREWPVLIFLAEDDVKSYTWDRAPISFAMKEGTIRKNGNNYILRILALEDTDIGSILTRADVSTQLLEVDDNGYEEPSTAYIVELNKEGGVKKREGSTAENNGQAKRGRNRKTKKEEDHSSPPSNDFFEHGFEYLRTTDGSFIFNGRNGKKQADYVADGSKNVIFSINNISVFDPSPVSRSSVTQKYVLKTHFKLFFIDNGNSFVVESTDSSSNKPNVHHISVKSMPFEASSNASTHWKKSFAAIWDTIVLYHFNRGELRPPEIEKAGTKDEKEKQLCWLRVKEMVRHFISCRSEYHVRPLMETELRTISRMILARRLADFNEVFKGRKNGKGWIINELSEKEKEQIQDRLLCRRITEFPAGKTFTQILNSEMQSVAMNDGFLVKQSDFTDDLLVLSGASPVTASCSIYSWLRSASDIIAGPTLHLSPKTTVRLFNEHLITLRSAESARRTARQIILRAQPGTDGDYASSLIIRVDEREESRLLYEMIEPSSNDPYHFGFHPVKLIKETKLAINKEKTTPYHIDKAIGDGVITKTKGELCGLYAVLKSGYLRGFNKIIQSSPGKIFVIPLFKSVGTCVSVYPYDFAPAEMVENEVDPTHGPRRNKESSDNEVYAYSEIDTVITQSMAGMKIRAEQTRSAQRPQPANQPTRPMQQQLQQIQPTFAAPYTPESHRGPAQMPVPTQQVHNEFVQNVHYYPSDSPQYLPYPDQMAYSTQGMQHPFTPPDPVNGQDNESGISMNNNHPDYTTL